VVFCYGTTNLGTMLVRAPKKKKKTSIECRLDANSNKHSGKRCKLNLFNLLLQEDILGSIEKPQGRFIKITFDGSKTSQGAVEDFIISNGKGRFFLA